VVVSVAAGQNTGGVDINVVTPASSTPPNAQLLGSGQVAQNTGDVVHRGGTASVFLCGPGLSGSMQVFISGSTFGSATNDITVSGISTVRCSGTVTSGIGFNVNAAGNAALGARTVVLQAPNNDITTFTGGLEVVP